jgi:N-hydroxyarylamine O-acetyltransferase
MDFDRQDLESYFTRIKYSGPREPTLEVLRELQLRHVETFPFENLDVLLGRPIKLDAGSLAGKLIHGGRGGYCFEQNGMFWRVLTALGFTVTPLAAKVRLWIPDDIQTGRTHLLLKVDLPEGPYIVDVGFGGLNPTGPFALVCDVEQPTSLETYRIVAWDIGYELHARLGEVWTVLYRFTLEPMTLPDQEIANWFVATSPVSLFVQSLVMARPGDGRRMTLRNAQFAIRHRDGRLEERTVEGADDLIDTVWRYFDLDIVSIGGVEGAKAIVERCFPAGQNRVL